MTDAQTEARAIAWRGEYKQPGTDRWIVRYVDDGKPTGKNWRNVLPLFDATALAANDAELAAVHQRYVDANEARIDAEAQLAEANKALEPFAAIADTEDEVGRDDPDDDRVWVVQAHGCQIGDLTIEHFRAARRALTGGQEDG